MPEPEELKELKAVRDAAWDTVYHAVDFAVAANAAYKKELERCQNLIDIKN